MAKILALDIGEQRVGLAVSDELKIIASPYKTIGREKVIFELKQIVEKEKIEKIIIGLPYLGSGQLGSQAKDIQRFAHNLRAEVNVPIEFENEILTSVEAENRLRERRNKVLDKEEIDKMAATIILESYLGREKN
jgi:putative Holliday junction resolvase